METKNKEEILEIGTELSIFSSSWDRNVFDELIGGLDMARERICELVYVSVATSQTQRPREKGMEKKNKVSKNYGAITKS